MVDEASLVERCLVTAAVMGGVSLLFWLIERVVRRIRGK